MLDPIARWLHRDSKIYFCAIDLGLNLCDYTQKKFLVDHMADQRLRIVQGLNRQFD